MSENDLKYSQIYVDQEKKEIRHEVDQFYWFEKAMDYGEVQEEVRKESMVQFVLPSFEQHSSRAILAVIGCGIHKCEAYLSLPNGKKTEFLKIFRYEPDRQETQITEESEKDFHRENRIFTTQETPFLHRGGYPPNFDRVYNFQLIGSDSLEVRACPREDRSEDYFSVSFIDGNNAARKTNSVELVRLVRFSENNEKPRWARKILA